MRYALALLATASLLLAAGLALAQTGGSYDLSWNTVDSGGNTFSNGGSFSLGSTIGQADAGVMSGGNYVLGGGFWMGGEVHAPAPYRSLLPLVIRQSP